MTIEQMNKIERYLNREMTEEEQRFFQTELEKDPELRKAFNLMRLTGAAIKRDQQKYEEFKKKFLEARREPIEKVIPLMQRAWVGWAAAILLGGLFIWQYFKQPTTASSPADQVTQIDTGDEDEISVGEGAMETTFFSPVVSIVRSEDSLKVTLQTGPEIKAILSGSNITLVFPPGSRPDSKYIKFFYLVERGKKTLYLNIKSLYYKVKQGEQLLLEESDPQVLRYFPYDQ